MISSHRRLVVQVIDFGRDRFVRKSAEKVGRKGDREKGSQGGRENGRKGPIFQGSVIFDPDD